MRSVAYMEPPRNPFWILVRHFAQRLLAAEEETDGGFSLGLGAVLGILASPGAFASIFLLDKYSTLMQWLRHQNLNSYKASVADEYFFVVLSMTITGLVMVLRWNRLFPDPRDFANLAVLPIPIRDVFFANFLALFGLAVLFAIDVNAFSAIFFPFIVTISDGQGGSFAKLLIMIRSHAASVFLSSLFSFFCIFGAVGILTLLVPKRLFSPVSLAVRIVVVVALLAEFFANMLLQLFSGHLSGASAYARFLPSFWFLGIYESSAGLASSGMKTFAERALSATVVAICISLAAYLLCYRRRFLRLAESLDMVSEARVPSRLNLPPFLTRLLFPTSFEHACAGFISSVLMRSERHLMFLGAYLGVGFVLTAQTAMDSLNRHVGRTIPDADVLAVPLMLSFFIITGLRFVFEMPASLRANWIFRSILEQPSPAPRRPVRTLMLLSTFTWQIAVLFPVTCRQLGWRIAVVHTLVVMASSATLIEALLVRFQKIPFTCSTRPDIPRLLMCILGTLLGGMIFVPMLASLEKSMLVHPPRGVLFALLLGLTWYLILSRRREIAATGRLTFEDGPPAQFELLKLS